MDKLFASYFSPIYSGNNDDLLGLGEKGKVLINDWKRKDKVEQTLFDFISAQSSRSEALNYALLDGEKIIGLVNFSEIEQLIIGDSSEVDSDISSETRTDVVSRFIIESLQVLFDFKNTEIVKLQALNERVFDSNFTLQWNNDGRCLLIFCPSVMWRAWQDKRPQDLTSISENEVDDIREKQLNCQLANTKKKLSDIQGVALGDVIWTDSLLSDPIKVTLKGETVAQGHLARTDNKKALLLI